MTLYSLVNPDGEVVGRVLPSADGTQVELGFFTNRVKIDGYYGRLFSADDARGLSECLMSVAQQIEQHGEEKDVTGNG